MLTESLLHTAYLAGAYAALFGSAELLYHRLRTVAEVTRKYVHIVTGLLTLLFPPLIGNHWLVGLLCGGFLLILLASLRYGLLPSINGVARQTRGSLLYPITIYACYLAYAGSGQVALYYIPILVMALADPVAALVGKSLPRWRYRIFGHTKTGSGSLAFFGVAALVCSIVLLPTLAYPIGRVVLTALAVSLTTTLAEAVSHKGYDNLTIPAAAMGTLLLLNEYFAV